MTLHVEIIWGEYQGKDDLVHETYAFKTEGERNAFLLGAAESNGWSEYHLIGEDTKDYHTDYGSVRQYLLDHDEEECI